MEEVEFEPDFILFSVSREEEHGIPVKEADLSKGRSMPIVSIVRRSFFTFSVDSCSGNRTG